MWQFGIPFLFALAAWIGSFQTRKSHGDVQYAMTLGFVIPCLIGAITSGMAAVITAFLGTSLENALGITFAAGMPTVLFLIWEGIHMID